MQKKVYHETPSSHWGSFKETGRFGWVISIQWWKTTHYPAEHRIFYLEPLLLNVFSGELPPCMSPSNEECNREETSKHRFLSELFDLQVSVGPHFRKLTLQWTGIFFKTSRKKLIWMILLVKSYFQKYFLSSLALH